MKKLNLLFLFLSSILFGNNFELTKEEINYLNSKKIISMCVDPDWEPFEKINKYGITMTMNSKYEINDLTLSNISYHYTSVEMKDIWIHLPTSYLVIREINNKLIENMKVNGLAIVFVDENGNEL